jgi:hypothetical protein
VFTQTLIFLNYASHQLNLLYLHYFPETLTSGGQQNVDSAAGMHIHSSAPESMTLSTGIASTPSFSLASSNSPWKARKLTVWNTAFVTGWEALTACPYQSLSRGTEEVVLGWFLGTGCGCREGDGEDGNQLHEYGLISRFFG